MSDLHLLSVSDQMAALASGQLSSVELTRHYLDRIARLDPQVNSFITVTAEQALAQAQAADQARQNGTAGPLTGLPVAHKDIFCTQGVRTSCGSKMLDTFVAPYDATVIARCNAAGLVMLGKTNMDEFAMGSTSESSFYGPTRNPWALDRVPGGSSGGAAAAIAADLAPLATGSDTGGSIRQPAAFCGLTGIKPTYGRVSRFGMIAYASSLDQGGPMARSAADCAHLLAVMAGHDARDSTSNPAPVDDCVAHLNAPLTGLRIGLPRQYFAKGLDGDVEACLRDALAVFESLGATLVELDLSLVDDAIAAYYLIAPAEASSNLSRYDGVRYGHRCNGPRDLTDLYTRSRSEGFGPEVQRRILIGTYALSAGYYDAYYLKAQKVRRLIREDFLQAFTRCDVIAGPTTPSAAYRLGAKQDPVSMYLGDVYTVAVNLAGLPAISAPCGFDRSYSDSDADSPPLPVGLQLIGPDWSEARLLAMVHQYQQHTDWHTRRAPLAQEA